MHRAAKLDAAEAVALLSGEILNPLEIDVSVGDAAASAFASDKGCFPRLT
jgi:hypothetical protein